MTSGPEEPAPGLSFGPGPAPGRRLPVAEPTAAPPLVVDPDVLAKLIARFGDAGTDLRDSLIDTWLAEVVQRREDLRTAAAKGDHRKAAQVVHALRSGSGALGARELAVECGRVEEALGTQHGVDLEQARASVEAALDRAVEGLGALRGT